MDSEESAFLAGAFDFHESRLERQMLAGFHLVRAGCRIANGDDFDVGAFVAASRASVTADDFADDEQHRRRLDDVREALLVSPRSAPALHRAFSRYGQHLAKDSAVECALAVLLLAERLFEEGCDPLERLDATYRYGATLCRGARPLAASLELPLILAERARSAKSLYHLGMARALRVERTALSGNVRLAYAQAEALLEWAARHPFPRVLARAHLLLAMIHGRMGNFIETVRHATLGQRIAPEEAHDAENLLASALVDLDLLDEARRSYELARQAPYRAMRQRAVIGLMDVAIRSQDEAGFIALKERIGRFTMSAHARLIFLRDCAGGLACFGDTAGARTLLEECRVLAHSLGYGLDYMQADGDLLRLAAARTRPGAAPSAQRELAAELSSLRERHLRASHQEGFALA